MSNILDSESTKRSSGARKSSGINMKTGEREKETVGPQKTGSLANVRVSMATKRI